jgi:hypothetical protein
MADVVPDRLGAQVELGGDLLRRAALFQQTKHLDLTGSEMRGWRCSWVVGALLEQPEDTDHPFTAHQRHRTDLHGDPRAGGRNQDAGRIGGRGGPEDLPGEQLAGAPAVLGRDDGGELTPANVADETLGSRIDPADDSRRVEELGTPTRSRACWTSPAITERVAIREVWLIRTPSVIGELSHSEAGRSGLSLSSRIFTNRSSPKAWRCSVFTVNCPPV